MKGMFEIAGGSVIGRDHVEAGRNNQDAFAWYQDDDRVIAVVADGCSEGPHSEVGARLGVQWVIRALTRIASEDMAPAQQPAYIDGRWPFLNRVHDEVLDAMHEAAVRLSDAENWSRARADVIRQHFLFTVVGAIITAEQTFVFSIGDGCVAINGSMRQLGPFAGNAPPYIGYGLFPPTVTGSVEPFSFMNFSVERVPTAGVQSLCIGTDGLDDLIAAADRNLPGKTELVGPMDQFWTDDRYFRNPDAIRRRLTIINRESVRLEGGELVRESGLLRDDTTVVVMRRRKSETRNPKSETNSKSE